MTKRNKKPAPLTQDQIDYINSRIDANEATNAESAALTKTTLDRHEYKCDFCNAITLSAICWVDAPCGPGCMGVRRPTGRIVKAGA